MKLKWYGMAAVLMESADGLRIICDPCSSEYGYSMTGLTADVITVSHQHRDHNSLSCIVSDYTLLDQPGVTSIHGVEIKAVESYHDSANGMIRGTNLLFRFKIDNIYIVHAGDLGHVLFEEQILEMRPCDILLIPAGGVFTLSQEAAYKVVNQLKPSIVIPIHYHTIKERIGLNSEEEFVGRFLEVERKKELELRRSDLPNNTKAVVLYAHGEKQAAD